MSDHIHWIVEVSIKPGELEHFKSLMTDMVESTQANEPNTLNYEWMISDDNQTCHIYERYTDSASTMRHLSTFGANFAERFMAAVDFKRFVVYGNPSDELRKTLGGFNAEFLGPFGGFAR